jgi:hypothetical protein
MTAAIRAAVVCLVLAAAGCAAGNAPVAQFAPSSTGGGGNGGGGNGSGGGM